MVPIDFTQAHAEVRPLNIVRHADVHARALRVNEAFGAVGAMKLWRRGAGVKLTLAMSSTTPKRARYVLKNAAAADEADHVLHSTVQVRGLGTRL